MNVSAKESFIIKVYVQKSISLRKEKSSTVSSTSAEKPIFHKNSNYQICKI